jgi:hypothetical protein
MRAPQVVLAVNGERVAVSEHIDLGTSLADFIRSETRFKVCICKREAIWAHVAVDA